jgi:hypothetical protein
MKLHLRRRREKRRAPAPFLNARVQIDSNLIANVFCRQRIVECAAFWGENVAGDSFKRTIAQ